MRVYLVLFLSLLVGSVSANDLRALEARGDVRISATVQGDSFIVKQVVPVNIVIESALPFASGTRLKLPEITQGFIRQDSSFAINGTKTEGGVSWVTQTWSLSAYIQSSGQVVIPSIELMVSLKGSDRVVTGVIGTEPINVNIVQPKGTEEIANLVVSSSFKIDEKWSSDKLNFELGEALTRNLSYEIEGSPGMMIPDVKVSDIEGVDVYRVPPQVTDRSSRGELTGQRNDSVIYTFEKPGRYEIEGYTFHWWDLKNNELKEINAPAIVITVAGASASVAVKNRLVAIAHWFGQLPIKVMFIFVVLSYLFYRLSAFLKLPQRVKTVISIKRAERTFLNDLQQARYTSALDFLYLHANEKGEEALRTLYQGNQPCLAILDELFKQHYSSDYESSISREQGRTLLQGLRHSTKKKWFWQKTVDLKLN